MISSIKDYFGVIVFCFLLFLLLITMSYHNQLTNSQNVDPAIKINR